MAGGAAPKVEEPQAHPPKDQLPNVSYCITSPPPWRECLLSVSKLISIFRTLLLFFDSYELVSLSPVSYF